MKFSPMLRYKKDNQIYTCKKFDNTLVSIDIRKDENSIKVFINSPEKIELVEFLFTAKRKSAKNELFFSNGYQSWTTSAEMSCNDLMTDINPFAKKFKFTKSLAQIAGDYHFVNYSNEKGHLHSHTYTYFRNGNEYELYGSICENKGFTVFFMDYQNSKFTISKDVEGLVFEGELLILDIAIEKGSYDEVFDNYFNKMNLPSKRIQHLSGYTSWYNYFQKIDENIILRDLNGLDRAKNSTTIFQIDDGYQSFVGDWLVRDQKKFPRPMKHLADKIHEKGYLAGIWIAPFSCQIKSKVFEEHPDWVVKSNDNKNLLGCVGWGGAYTLDIYNEGAREYIKNFFNVILNDWGFDLVKLDFLYSECMVPRNGKSRGEIMYDSMAFLRECVGDKLILGCGVPLGSSFGFVDACRISCDVDLKYSGKFYNKLKINNEIPSAQNAINNTVFRRHLNKRAFCNDPDVLFLRDKNLSFTLDQKLLLGKINNLFGDVLFVSDNVGDYSTKEIELLEKFFKENNAKLISVDCNDNKDFIIKYIEENNIKRLEFNLKSGISNINEVL